MKRRLLSLVACMILLVCVCTACGGNEATPTKAPTLSPTQVSTQAPTQVPTLAPTQIPTQIPSQAPTEEPVLPLPEGQKGKPFQSGLEGVKVLYDMNYDDGNFDQYDVKQKSDYVHIVDGKIMMPTDASGSFKKVWCAYAPDITCYTTDAEQYEMQVEFSSLYPINAEGKLVEKDHEALLVGCFVANYRSTIPDRKNPDKMPDGFWVAFTSQNYAVIHPGSPCWPNGEAQVSLPATFETMRKLIVVITDENRIYYYVELDDGTQKLFLEADLSGETIICKDGSGNTVWTGENEVDTYAGSHFKFFAHEARVTMDNLKISQY